MAEFIVGREFKADTGRKLRVGDRIDSDQINSWRNGELLKRQRYLEEAPKRGRGRPRKDESNA